MTAPGTLSMAQTAPLAGLGYDRFQKTWRRLVRDEGFPSPISGKGRNYAWDPDAVMRWRARRSQELPPDPPEKRPANNNNRQRRDLAALAILRA